MEFIYNSKTNRWQYNSPPDKGKFVSYEAVKALTLKSIEKKQQAALSITDILFRKKITTKTWELAIAEKIKESTLEQYIIGKPGKLTQSDYGKLGGQLSSQYNFLRKLALEINQGTLSEKQIKQRINLYFAQTRRAFESECVRCLFCHRMVNSVWGCGRGVPRSESYGLLARNSRDAGSQT